VDILRVNPAVNHHLVQRINHQHNLVYILADNLLVYQQGSQQGNHRLNQVDSLLRNQQGK
jgi:hypothetical protein